MRNNPKDKDEYAQLKQRLAIKFPNDLMSYCIGKQEFVASIDAKSGWSGFKLVMVCTPKEKEMMKYLRNQSANIKDPYNLESKNQIHFVYYKENIIIGYAYIKLVKNKRAIIKIITIDHKLKENRYRKELLELCKKWVVDQGYISLELDLNI